MATKAIQTDSLICSMTTNAELTTNFFHHARLNTKKGKQVYFPVVSQMMNISSSIQRHIWRTYDFDYFCGYKTDLMRSLDDVTDEFLR